MASRLRAEIRHRWQDVRRHALRISSSIIGQVTQAYWREAECVFILSTGRTGTKTLARLLGLSSAIDAFHEPHPQLMEERKSARWEVDRNPSKYRNIFIRSRGTSLLRASRRGTVYAETSARMTFFAPVIAELLPTAKFIYIHREPTAIVRSGMRRGWYGDHPADFARICPIDGEDAFADWDQWSPFEKICWYWDAYNRFALDFGNRVNASRMLTLRADEIFDGTAVPPIFSHIGVEAPSSEQVDRVLSKKLNAQQRDSFPKAKAWTNDMFDTLYELAGDTMMRLGHDPKAEVQEASS